MWNLQNINSLKFTTAPALHSFLFSDNETSLYHTGNTGLFYDMKLIRELYSPEVVFLPMGDHYLMGPKEPAKACNNILITPKIGEEITI